MFTYKMKMAALITLCCFPDFVFSDCVFQTEEKNATIVIETKSITDIANDEVKTFRFTSDGVFEVQPGANSVHLCMIGGGGGGGALNWGHNVQGGKSGQIVDKTVSVISGKKYSVVIGVGGKGVTGNVKKGGNGTASSVFGIIANGGAGGDGSSSGYKGDGELRTGCWGTSRNGYRDHSSYTDYGGEAGFEDGGNGNGGGSNAQNGGVGAGGGGHGGDSGRYSGSGGRGEVRITTGVCKSGYVLSGDICVKKYTYSYTKYTCDKDDVNSQGFGWVLSEPPYDDGVKIDPDVSSYNDLSGNLVSHSTVPKCIRKYQECTIDCVAPLVLDKKTGKCVADYKTICEYKGMVYNEELKTCEKKNECLYDSAIKDSNSSYCVMKTNCVVSDGVCSEIPSKSCSINGFIYEPIANQCEKSTSCTELEYVLDNGFCGSTPYCNSGDVQSDTECINTVTLQKSCLPDARDGNLCYVSNGSASESDTVTTYRALLKTELDGGFKENEYGNTLSILCSDDSFDCQFRMVKIAANDTGDQICFTDAQGVSSCISIVGGCKVSGSIENPKGIKQLKVESGNKIVGYDLEDSHDSIGSILSTCSISGKVGNFEGEYVSNDIISVDTNGSDILFWDKYKRGFVGVISFLPTIPSEDLNDGYTYKDSDVYTLLNRGFTAFYSKDSASVYGVYNGFISKNDCLKLIDGTSFYIVQPQNSDEKEIVSGLNFKSGDNYNYNDGDLNNGSCVIKSNISQSFNSQEFSVKTVKINNSNSIFVCSPFKCKDHFCQYNQCQTNYDGTLYDQTYFDQVTQIDFPDSSSDEICTDQLCDSNKPYFKYCGNSNGCENKVNIYQQSDGTCVEVTCDEPDQLDVSTGKCIGYGCNGAIERDGKCYKTLY